MKRKIIKQKSAFTCTLPVEWIREHNLDAGHEIDINAVDGSLVLSTDKKKKTEKIHLHAKKIDAVIERFIPALYRAGYDEIEVSYEDAETLKHIQAVLERELIGYEIVSQGQLSCTIKDISGLEHEAFETLLRRCFLLMLSNAKQCSHGLKTKNAKVLEEIAHRDKNINKLTNLCERLLIKKSTGEKKAAFLFHLIKELENIADEYKYLAEHHLKNKDFSNRKGIELLDTVNAALEKSYHLFYNFRGEDAALLEQDMNSLKTKLISQKDVIFAYHLMSIFRRLHTMLSGHFSLKL